MQKLKSPREEHEIEITFSLRRRRNRGMPSSSPSAANIWVSLGLGVAGIILMARKLTKAVKEDSGAFVERLQLLPPPQPPPPKAPHPLTGLSFAVADVSSTSTGRIMWQIFCGSCCWLCGFLFGVILLSKKNNGKRLSSSTPKQSNLVGKMQHITVIGLLHTWNRGECEGLSKKRDCKGDAWRLQGSN